MKRATAARRSVPIHMYVGGNGHGKSLAMVFDTIPTLRGLEWRCDNPAHRHTQAGETSGLRRVLSTVRLLDPRTGETHPLWDPFTEYSQLIEAEHCDVLMDEVAGIVSSRDSGLPADAYLKLQQLRRSDVIVRLTAPAFARTEKSVREICQGITVCKGSFMRRPKDGRKWGERRLFLWKTYDATLFDDWTEGKRDKLKAQAVQVFLRPGSAAQKTYDTLDAVLSLTGVGATGVCSTCNGTRRRHACKCDDENLRVIGAPTRRAAAQQRAS
jgi:hypothetical protein